MLNILGFILNLIDQRVIWLYAACLLVILYNVRTYAQARNERRNSIFTIEQEVAAHREGQAMSNIGVLLGIAVVITAVKFYVLPSLDLAAMVESPVPTLTLAPPTRDFPTLTPTSMLTMTVAITPAATLRPSPTLGETPTALAATATTSAPPSALCPNTNVRITSPGMNAQVSGRIAIYGTATHDRFQFYKVEYAQGEQPGAWHVVNSTHQNPVGSGLLEQFNTAAIPNGVYWLQLTVVDQSGNFPSPCRVRIVIRN